ncbi:MAG: PEP-CTERM sorting domain-containing protein [Planctomycetota bacterium]
MKRIITAVLGLGIAGPMAADLVGVRDYSAFHDPYAANLVGTSRLVAVDAGPVTITPDAEFATGSYGFGGATFSLSPFPRDGQGFISTSIPAPVGNQLDQLVLNLSEPVAAFGVTFSHRDTFVFQDVEAELDTPAVLSAYSEADGGGELLGTVQSLGLPTGVQNSIDFVGLVGDEREIRSVVLTGSGPYQSFAVDAYAVSLVPEPGGLVLLGFGGLLLARRRRGSSLLSESI